LTADNCRQHLGAAVKIPAENIGPVSQNLDCKMCWRWEKSRNRINEQDDQKSSFLVMCFQRYKSPTGVYQSLIRNTQDPPQDTNFLSKYVTGINEISKIRLVQDLFHIHLYLCKLVRI